MKLRVIGLTFAVVALTCGSAMAQAGGSIGIYDDALGTSCDISATAYVAKTFFILAKPNVANTVGGITGAEFRVVGAPGAADAIINPTPNAGISVTIGAPFDNGGGAPQGVNAAFATCEPVDAQGFVMVYSVQIILLNPVTDVVMEIMQKDPSSNPNFQCPLVTACDPPTYTAFCVLGGKGYLNHSAPSDCLPVAVEEATWTKVKNLYN